MGNKWQSLDRLTRLWHSYAGLYFFLFLWLFCISGLLLNHHWKFADFWETRVQSSEQRPIERPGTADALATARALMSQLNLAGEVARADADVGVFEEAELEQEPLERRRLVQRLAAVLDVERVAEPLDEPQPPGRRRRRGIVDRVDRLHVPTLPTGIHWCRVSRLPM